VLKRGITSDGALWEWFVKYVDAGEIELRDGQVELLSVEEDEEKTVRAWKFTGAYPVKWTGPELNAMSAGVAFETVELAHRGVRLVEP
jgi:phage tail-like protein